MLQLKTGAGSDMVYVPSVKWFSLLDASLRNLTSALTQSESNLASTDSHTDDTDTEQNSVVVDTFHEPTPAPPPPKKKRIAQLSSMVSQLKEITDSTNATVDENVFDVFGKHVGVQLKSLPILLALEAQEHIQLYLNKIRREHLQNESELNRKTGTPQSLSPSIVVSESEDHFTFLRILDDALSHLSNKNIIIAVDINIKFGTNSRYCSAILDLLSTFGFQQMITENTRNDHCIDNIFINFNITSCIATVESKFCSDHLGQKIIFQPPKTLPVSSAKIVCRPITEYGKFVFFNLVDKLNWDFIQDSSLNCDNKFELFIHKLQNCLHEAFPEKNLPCRPDMNIIQIGSTMNLEE
nr:unnamed protein product [Callosobruchus analis]